MRNDKNWSQISCICTHTCPIKLSRVHSSAKTQQSPLIHSSLIQYQIKYLKQETNHEIKQNVFFCFFFMKTCSTTTELWKNDFFSSLPCLIPVLVGEALSGFSVPEVVRVARLKDGLSVLELFHGQTLAFKDLAMTCTVRFLNYFLQKENHRATVVVGEK